MRVRAGVGGRRVACRGRHGSIVGKRDGPVHGDTLTGRPGIVGGVELFAPTIVGSRDVAGFDASDLLDDNGLLLADGAVGMQELVGNVAEDGGAAGGDAAFGDEDEEASKEFADVVGGGEFGEFGEEIGAQVGEIAVVLLEGGADGGTFLEVLGTKPKMGIVGVPAAALAIRETMAATSAGFCTTWRGAGIWCNCLHINGGDGIRGI